MNRKLLIGLGALVLLGFCFVGVGGYVRAKRKAPRTGDQFYLQGAIRFNERDYARAYHLFTLAVQKDPTNGIYCREAARAASLQGRLPEAQLYAQKAWENGLKEADLLRLIVSSYGSLDKTNAMPMVLKLLDELPDTTLRSEFRGDIFYHFNETKAAFEIWQRALSVNATNSELIVKVAKAYLQRKEVESAKRLLEQFRAKGSLNEEGYSILAYVYAGEEDYKAALEVFDGAKAEGKYRDRLTLEHALVFLINQRLDEARAILEASAGAAGEPAPNILRTQIRVFLGYVLLVKRDREALQKLLAAVSDKLPNSPAREAEQLYFNGLLHVLDNKPQALESFAKARRLLPGQPAIELLFAQESIKIRNYSAAVDSLKDIRGVLERWPPLNYELAVALHGNRQDRLALQALSKLHKRKMVSKESLELFRDIAFQNNLNKASKTAQDLLEKAFPADADVQLFRGLTAMQEGELTKAGEIFQELGKKYPDDVRFKLGPIQVLLAEGRFAQALQACKSSTAPAESLAALMAIAHLKLHQWDEAEAAFQKAILAEQPAMVYTEYGKLLAERGRPGDASALFQQAVAKSPDQIEAYVGLALVAVENRQWENARRNALSALTLNAEIPICYYVLALADTQAGDPRKALENCQIALKKNPELARARLLQATLQNLFGQSDEAEKEFVQLLRTEPDDPFLRQQLAILYRRKGEYKKAFELIEPVAKARPENQNLQFFRFEVLALAGQPRQAEALLSAMKPSLAAFRYDLASSWLADVEGDVDKAVALLESHLGDRTGAIQWATVQLKNKKQPGSWVPLLKHQLTADEWAQLAAPAELQQLWLASTYCYEQALKLDPNNPKLLNNWAWSAMNLKEFDREKVLDAVRRSYAAFSKNPAVLDTYAEALLRTTQYRECVDLLNANLSVTRRTPQLLLLLAKAYEANNDLENSLRTYRQVLDLQTRTKDWDLRMGRDALSQQIHKLESKVN